LSPAVALRSKTVHVDAAKLVELRTRKNWTQEKLADKSIVSVRTVQNIEQGRPALRSTLARLASALGVSAELLLAATVLQTAPSEPALSTLPSVSPYRGLLAFAEADAKYFFGRDRVVALLASKLAQSNLLQISGPSGSGKSSLVLAGLIPELRRSGACAIIACRPGPDPFVFLSGALISILEPSSKESARVEQVPALARSLEAGQLPLLLERVAEKTGGALLFIDQFEEIFALCNQDVTRSRFIDSLVDAASDKPYRSSNRIKIVCAIRSDWAHRVFSYRGYTDFIQDADIKIGPLTGEEIRQAIEQPASLCGVRFEPGLVQRLVVDAGAEPGTLPLLQFALARLWERQTSGLLTHAAYDEIGLLSGAIANRAEAVFRSLSSTQQDVARGILTSLVHLAEDSDAHTRRRLPVADLFAQDRFNTDEGRQVLHLLVEARLLTSGFLPNRHQETVELAHEAVIRRWPRFSQWLQEDGDLLAWRERFRIILEQWQNSGRDDGFLLRGPLLDESTLWLARRGAHLSTVERQLINASNARRQQDRWNRPVRSVDVLIEASPRDVSALGPSLHRQDAGAGQLWRLQVQLFAVPAVQQRELSSRLPHVPANQALPLLAAKPSVTLEVDETGEFLEDSVTSQSIGTDALASLENMQRRGGTGPALEFLGPQLDSIRDATMRLKFASILFDMMHLRGRYEDAANLIEQELAFHTRSDAQVGPLVLSLRIRLLHHQMFYRPVDDVWPRMVDLLPECDSASPYYGEILFMLGGNLGALRGDYRQARRFLVRALRHAFRRGDEYLVSRCLRKYGDYLRCRGHLQLALVALREARRLAQRGRGTRQRIYITGCLGDLERQRGNFEAARQLFEQTLAWAKEAFIPGWVGHAYLGLAELAFATRQVEQAEERLEQAESHYRTTRPCHHWGEVQVGYLRGRLLQAKGRQQWRDVLEETHRRASTLGYRRDAALLGAVLHGGSNVANALMFL
jgi:transcriptional regulator with XRE-family HTH domain/tetratricopeptide (TPR) repeat protein